MKKLLTILLGAVLLAVCCTKPDDPVDPGTDPVVDPGTDPGADDPEPQTPAGKPRYVWIDAAANFYYFADDKAYIARELGKLADCGFTDIIVDVRPTEGTVLWKSAVAPQARRLATWLDGHYRFVEREAEFDYLQAFIDCGHAAGLDRKSVV